MKMEDLLEKRDALCKDIAETEQGLSKLRNVNPLSAWEENISKDTRKSVRVLYDSLLEMRNEYKKLCATWVGVMDEEDAKCLSIGRGTQVDSSEFKAMELARKNHNDL
jgi:hypothetical protein